MAASLLWENPEMASIVDFLSFKGHETVPTLVLVGLHQHPDGEGGDRDAYDRMLANCRALLDRAKARDIPIAHARRIHPKGVVDRLRYPPWIAGFEPVRCDMVFDLLQPSCYSNAEFSRAMDHSGGNFAIAGMFGETTCLSTAIDAHHRRHKFAYLADATLCRSSGSIPAPIFHEAVAQVMAVYGTVTDGVAWSRRLSRRRNAG
jgi:nicotinamidase-related amidase